MGHRLNGAVPSSKEIWGRSSFSRYSRPGTKAMAKPATVKIRLVSSADTGFFYVTKKNPRTKTEKLSFRKYDLVVRKHVELKEAKIKCSERSDEHTSDIQSLMRNSYAVFSLHK